jgi:putative nucleotidyltransferase with HDIG domain
MRSDGVYEKRKPILQRLQQRLEELPLLPVVVFKLMTLEASQERYFEQVVELIGRDPAFASRILRVANSAAMGPSVGRAALVDVASPTEPAPARGITRLGDAVMRMGARGAVDLVVVHSISRVFLPRTQWERDLWIHALSVGSLARKLAGHMKAPADPDIAYLAGLLHDLGRFVLSLEAPEELRAIDETAWEMPAELIAAEKKLCGFTHPELGFLAAQRWQLPDDLALLIQYHHADPGPPLVAPHLIPLIQLVRVADWLTIMFSKNDLENASDDELGSHVSPHLGPLFRSDVARLVPAIRSARAEAATAAKELRL